MTLSTVPDELIVDGDVASTVLACPSCDHLFDVAGVADGETARCTGCNHFLTQHRSNGLLHVLAYSISACLYLVVACSFAFLSFRTGGLESVMTLPQTITQLVAQGMPYLALLVAGFILVIPTFVLALILFVTIVLLLWRPSPWLRSIARFLFILQSWSMADVFLVGVIVSLVKITKMATVTIGLSFWAYVAFIICFMLALASLDRYQCWHQIDELAP